MPKDPTSAVAPSAQELQRNQERAVETIRRTARWRRAKADEHPESQRQNRRGATALRILANFVEELDADDRDLSNFRHIPVSDDGDAYRLSEEAATILARFGLNLGAWEGKARPSEAQLRNVLRRVTGAESTERHRARQRAEAGYGDN